VSALATHHIAADMEDGHDRALGLCLASGTIRAVRILNGDVAAVFFRRFRRAGAICIAEAPHWPHRLELELIAEGCGEPPTVHPIPDASTPESPSRCGSPPWQRLSAIEQWLIEQAPTEAARRDARYFHALDCRFNSRIVRERGLPDSRFGGLRPDPEAIETAVESLQGHLISRLGQRQRRAPFPPTNQLAPGDRLIEPIFTAMMQDRFDSAACESTTDEALETFSRFGAGEIALDVCPTVGGSDLHSRISNGGPDGSMVFAFAEYALLQIESNPKGAIRDLWNSVIPGCVLAAEMYLAAYGLHTREGAVMRRGFAGDSATPAPLLRHPSPRSRDLMIALYRQRYSGTSLRARTALEHRFASMLATAFHPIDVAPVRRAQHSHPLRGPRSTPGVNGAIFPQLPGVDVSTPSPQCIGA